MKILNKKTIREMVPFEATHPGILIRDELEVRPEIRKKGLAKKMGVKVSFLNEIIKGKRSITAGYAIILEEVFGISADYWMRFQSRYEIDKVRIKEKKMGKSIPPPPPPPPPIRRLKEGSMPPKPKGYTK